MLLYYILSLVPVIINIQFEINPYGSFLSNIDIVWNLTYYIAFKPVYLIIINLIFIGLKKIKYLYGTVYMLVIVFIDFMVTMIFNFVHYRNCWGHDTPSDLYFALYGIPCAIIVIGMLIAYMCKRTSRTKIIYYVFLLIPVVVDVILTVNCNELIVNIMSCKPNITYFCIIKPIYLIAVCSVYILRIETERKYILTSVLSTIAIDFFATLFVFKMLYYAAGYDNIKILYTGMIAVQCIIVAFGIEIIFFAKNFLNTSKKHNTPCDSKNMFDK